MKMFNSCLMKAPLSFFLFFILTNAYSQNKADSAFYNTDQSQWLTKKTGHWDVIMTLQPTAHSTPIIIKGLECTRTMIGAFCLHEVMQPIKEVVTPAFQRLADLCYNYNDARWDYMSIDTRITGGIMFFTYVPGTKDSIVSYMNNTVHPGFGPEQTDRGKNMRVRNVIITINAEHDRIQQYWKLTDGQEWLAVVYDYIKRK